LNGIQKRFRLKVNVYRVESEPTGSQHSQMSSPAFANMSGAANRFSPSPIDS